MMVIFEKFQNNCFNLNFIAQPVAYDLDYEETKSIYLTQIKTLVI